jgi:hypothetical protein
MFEGISEDTVQADLARIFGRIWEKKGPEALEREAAGAIAGLSSMIYRACGSERLRAILEAAPDAVECDIVRHFRRFEYQVIPADDASPILNGAAMMWKAPHELDLRRVIEAHLCGQIFCRLQVLHNDQLVDMFADSLADAVLPRNERATAILRSSSLTQRPDLDPARLPFVAGTAVLFDEPVWFA